MKKIAFITSLILGASLLISACSSNKYTPYPKQHAQLMQGQQQALNLPVQMRHLQALFADIKQPNLNELIDKAYAEEIYFNDTFHTFRSRDELKAYLTKTADKVETTRTYFEDVAVSGDNYYLRWRMEIEADIGVKKIVSESIGMTQFRFNEKGQVVFHQDFWDNTEGFFRHVPLLGGMIGQIKKRL